MLLELRHTYFNAKSFWIRRVVFYLPGIGSSTSKFSNRPILNIYHGEVHPAKFSPETLHPAFRTLPQFTAHQTLVEELVLNNATLHLSRRLGLSTIPCTSSLCWASVAGRFLSDRNAPHCVPRTPGGIGSSLSNFSKLPYPFSGRTEGFGSIAALSHDTWLA